MKRSLCLIALLLTTLARAQNAPAMVHSCDDLQGVSLNNSGKLADTKLEIVTAAAQAAQGQGSLRARSVSPANAAGNTYLSVVFTGAPVDLRGKALVFEAWSNTPDKSLALYVRGFDAQGACVLSWLSWGGLLKAEKTTFTLIPGVSYSGLAWEPDMVTAPDHSAVVRWEVFTGTHDPGTLYDLCLDHLRLETATVKSFSDTQEPHPLRPETTLVQDGRAQAFIAAPAEKEWQQAAADLAAALEKATGAKLEVKDGNQLTNADLQPSHVVLLGNVANNRALLYPYSHLAVFADGVFPGAGGYELKTAQDPWGKGNNLIVVGASDLPGLQAGIQALLARVKAGASLTLPRLCEVKLGGEAERRWGSLFTQTLDEIWMKNQQSAAERALETGGHTGLMSQIATTGETYALTGREPYARLYVWLVQRAYAHYQTKPDTFGGPWGMDSDFPSHRVIMTWDVVEECPLVMAEERLEIARILFRYISDAALPEGQGAAAAARTGRLVSNHGTFAALGTFCAGEFFSKYYGSAEAENWIKIGDETFTHLAQGSKVHEDCNGYQWLTQYHIVRYSLIKPDLTYFANGNARKAADFAILTMNNLGYQVPYGDTGAWVCWFSELPVLRACEWYYRDGRYQWAINKKMAVSPRLAYGECDPQGAVKEPVELLGAHLWPLDSKYHHEGGKTAPPLEKAWDKIAFRDGFTPQHQYLLLDGLSNGGHRHMDGNSILQWTEKDRVWLADADYIKSLPKYHNGVLILKDGQSATIPDFSELEQFADLPHLAGSVTTVRNYAGVDWRRHVLWLKGQAFVVVDQMVAKEAGDYSFRAVWQTVGEARLNESGLDVNQKGQYGRFAMTADARCLLTDDPATGKNWSSYPHADKPIVRVFQGVCNRRLQAGQRFSLFTVLHASGEAASPVRLTRLNDNQAVVNGLGDPVLVALPDATGAMSLGDEVQLQATALVVNPQKAYMLGLRKLPAGMAAPLPLPPAGVDVEADINVGSAYVKLPSALTAGAAQQVLNANLGEGFPAEEVRGFLNMARTMAAPATAATTPAAALPALKAQWTYRDKVGSYLLTNNADIFEAVDTGLKLTCSPQPLPANVFGDTPTNTLDNLTDGVLLSGDGGVMWDQDQAVTLDLALDNTYDLHRLDLKAWFATASSKGKTYQLGRLQAWASSDGFRQDKRALADLTDDKSYGNWGSPGYGPQTYSLGDLKGKARQLRLTLTPRPGTGLYLAELQLWGNRPGLEVDLTKRLAQGVPVHVFRATHGADLDGDQRAEVLAGSTNGSVYCFSPEGSLKWTRDLGAAVNCLTAVDFQGDGRPTVLAGVNDARVIALDTTGKELWTFRPPYYKRAGHPRTMFPADLEGQGKPSLIVGAENWHYYAVDGSGKMIWKYESVHGSTAGCAADLDGDKKDEVVAGTEYYWWHVINPNGSRRFGFNTKGGPCANAVATGDLDGDGRREVLFGGADTQVQVLGQDGKWRWSFNTGDEVTAVACADVNGDGQDEVLVASLSFNVYCLDGAGQMLWRQDLGDQVQNLAVVGQKGQYRVAAGCDTGEVILMQGSDGRQVGRLATASRVLGLATADLSGKSTPELLVATADGNLAVVSLP